MYTIYGMIIIWILFVLFREYRIHLLEEHAFLEKQWDIIYFDIQKIQSNYNEMLSDLQAATAQWDQFQKYGVFSGDALSIYDYLIQMKQKHSRLMKHYTDNANLNAMLVYEESVCRNLGIEADFYVGQLYLSKLEEEKLIRLLLKIMEYILVQMNEERGERSKKDFKEKDKKVKIHLLLAQGQILICAEWTGSRKIFSWKRKLKNKENERVNVVKDTFDQGNCCLELMMETG